MTARANISSAGHALGQKIGDFLEEYFAVPLLTKVATELELYLDHRFRRRTARGEKILWSDTDNNKVDYDLVLELGGSDESLGVPVAFLETFWRRGARHSKDKARDDSGKLMPMRAAHPTARFLGIIASGDFTAPARQLVLSRDIDLFYVPKAKVIESFRAFELQVDYPDRSSEQVKRKLSSTFTKSMTPDLSRKVADRLRELVGDVTLDSYVHRVRAALGALPQEFRFICKNSSAPQTFESIESASSFLRNPTFDFSASTESYLYEITYSDGTEFEREVATLDELRTLHNQIDQLATHINTLR